MVFKQYLSLILLAACAACATAQEVQQPKASLQSLWPSVIDETTGRRVYQLTDRPGHNMSFYYLFKNEGTVDGVPYLAYRNQADGGITYYSINLNTGEEVELTERGMVGSIADVVGEYLYCLKKANRRDSNYSYIIRSNLKTGKEETLFELDPAYTYSANLTVSPDGAKVLFIRPKGEGEIDLLCGVVADGSQRVIASGKMSHVMFGPVNPDLYMYIDQTYGRNWLRTGIGWVDLENNIIFNEGFKTRDAFFNRTNGHLIPSHLHWDSDGHPAVTAVDTSRPYIDEYNVVMEPDKNRPGEILTYRKAQIRMGEFQTHFNHGPTPTEWVGDGMSADWWHKPGFGKPYIHKVIYDYEKEQMTQIPMADQVGVYWKSGPYEANARYIPGRDLVVWSSFRTLDGQEPDFLTPEQVRTGSWEESSESWLYSAANTVMQNVFAVDYRAEDRTGWDFAADAEGWRAGRDIRLGWTDGGAEDAAITGRVFARNAPLFSPERLNLPCEAFDQLMIRLKNESEATLCKVYYTTDESPFFSESKSVTVAIEPASDTYRSYFVPLAADRGWRGTLLQLKIEPLSNARTGTYTIPVIRLVQREPQAITIGIIGDSTVSDYPADSLMRGWGQLLPEFLTEEVRVINEAIPGRSTKNFPREKWLQLLQAKPDFVLIQFGHNDSHARGRPESTDADGDFRDNLRNFIREARAAGSTPVLVTPPHRRLFRGGSLTNELSAYVTAMHAVAAEEGVALVDLQKATGEAFRRLGEAGSTQFTVNTVSGNGGEDRTHFSEYGARELARMVASAFAESAPALRQVVRKDAL